MSVTNQQTLLAYDEHVKEYIARTPAEINSPFRAWIDDNLAQLPTGAHILEIGSASGRDADYIEDKGFTVERTDASKGFVGYLTRNGHSVRTLNVLTDQLGEQYDMVFANAVLLHFTRQEVSAVVRKVYDALMPSGRFVFSLKQGDGEGVEDQKLGAPRYFCYWQPLGIKTVLSEAGFLSVDHRLSADYRLNNPGWLLVTATKKEMQ